MLSVSFEIVMLNVIMLNVIILNVIMLIVIMLIVIMLIVVAPKKGLKNLIFRSSKETLVAAF